MSLICPHKYSSLAVQPYDPHRYLSRPNWGIDPYCYWCMAWAGVYRPRVEDTFAQITPQMLYQLLNKYNRIHHNYRNGLYGRHPRDYLPHDVDRMAKLLRKLYRSYPYDALGQMAMELNAMAADLQSGYGRNRHLPVRRGLPW